ncbi:MAG TPA: 4,5-DOPA dioxygenase extradiol [Spongiibacteraceae bacterium]|jgi:4,5-DOPA dioxygenase extradiol|nr:4,5-DOPA dioxygenase extradiol [Spongiibacteraceae bacterium]HUH36415.1 4,5-DOPA dioxygenase extradiol [Spongiibacteraceae bacterium]
MPALFIAHGNPMNALAANAYSADWHDLMAPCPRPSAILVISAHWETRNSQICAVPRPETIHDFRGFPAELFAIRYPSPGAPDLASRIAREIPAIALTRDWGLDHGSWSVLCHLFPEADIPVLQLSLATALTPAQHYALGRQLQGLRADGVLVLGSGNIVHNLRRWFSDPDGDTGWAQRFDRAVAGALENRDHAALINYPILPEAAHAVPTPEHYLPLLYIAALQQPGEPLRMSRFDDSSLEAICMRSVRIG